LSQSLAIHLNSLNNLTQYFKQYFPNTTIYPLFGNHENFPSDQYDTVGNDTAWLPRNTSDLWKQWLDEEAYQTFRQYGYYSMYNQAHNLRVIALNTQACDVLNFYLLEDLTDPLNHLAWLKQQLYDAESKNQTVWLTGHIPPGSYSCYKPWTVRYKALVDRFTHIIRGGFFGHHHTDEFEVITSYNNSDEAVGVVFIDPSLTTYVDLNPSFKVFTMDNNTNLPLKIDTYTLNLTYWNNQSNLSTPTWDLTYTLPEAYNMTDLSFQSFYDLAQRLSTDQVLLDLYVYNYDQGGTPLYSVSSDKAKHYYCTAEDIVWLDAVACMSEENIMVTFPEVYLYLQQLVPNYT